MHSPASIETKDSWTVAVVALIAILMAFGAAWITPVALKDIAAEVGGTRSVPALAMALAWLGFSVWLTYVEVARLDAICVWCVGSAICMTLLAGLSAVRLVATPA